MAFMPVVVAAAAAGFVWWKRSNDRADEIYQWLASTEYVRKRDHTNEASRNAMDAVLVHLRIGNQRAAHDEYQGLCARVAETRLLQSELVQRFKLEFPRDLVPYELAKTVFLPTYPEISEVDQVFIDPRHASPITRLPVRSTGVQYPLDTLYMKPGQTPSGRMGHPYDQPQHPIMGAQPPTRVAESRGRPVATVRSEARQRSMSPRRSRRGGGLTAAADAHAGYRSRSPVPSPTTRLSTRSGPTAAQHTVPVRPRSYFSSLNGSSWPGIHSSETRVGTNTTSDTRVDEDSTHGQGLKTTSYTANSGQSTSLGSGDTTENDSMDSQSNAPTRSCERPDDALVEVIWRAKGGNDDVVMGYVRELDTTSVDMLPATENAIQEILELHREPVIRYFTGRRCPTTKSYETARDLNEMGADRNRRCRPHRWFSAMIQATGTPQDEPCTKCAENNKAGKVMVWGKQCTKVDIEGLRCSNCEWHKHQGCKTVEDSADDTT